ncbi:response regulator transcription factor [Pseudohongiella sp.]|uniref:DNA-binding response regulator n=1 Tax=marine sediment metagenome TaxID=412755 RepID=A0A0F9VH79_9ZZZZ|nr:response regulator transcription factor [Pseudohongiella sp.]HDZ08844.1 response regulator transcription factor [Pseudohongiella sp.]HEA62821.1 response regulator transcription factor [Pseudohongiella sp.]
MKVLIADDERPLLNFIARGLSAEGLDCVTVSELHQVSMQAHQHQPDVIVLDRLFGTEDSVQVLPMILQRSPQSRILLLTALDDVNERVAGLRAGADDYLCKPFDFEELLARVQALGRRLDDPQQGTNSVLRHGSLTLDQGSRLVCLNAQDIPLTSLEFDLLAFLMQNSGKALSRERILNKVWGSQSEPLTNIVDVYVSRLRQKIDPASPAASMIQTVRGLGYRFQLSQNP